MKIAIPKEISPGEKRVALVPTLVQELRQLGCTILLEKGAGQGAYYSDQEYEGAEFCDDVIQLYKQADIVLKVDAPTEEEIQLLKEKAILIGLLSPARYPQRVKALRDRNITSFAMELIPRISRAQSMDVLSSQATIAGYKAVLIAASMFPRLFPMLTTAAGTIRPAQVLIIGAGVAGLQAIATARRLGAVVKAYDIRSAAREQIESLGAKMINIDVKGESSGGYARELTAEEQAQQQALLAEAIAKAEVVISTAMVPGKPAPKILTRELVDGMSKGSVIIDMAAPAGGNCELTQPDQIIQYKGISIYGPLNLPSTVARDASNMYAKNVVNFLKLFVKEGQLQIDWNDPILQESVLTNEGVIKHQPTQILIETAVTESKVGIQ